MQIHKNISVDSRGLAVSKEERIKPRMDANEREEEGSIGVDSRGLAVSKE